MMALLVRRLGGLVWPCLLLSPLVHASFSISTSGNTLQQCLQTELAWTEEPPIHLWAAPNAEDAPGDPTLRDFGVINGSSILWTVNLAVGQDVSFTYVRTADPTSLYSSEQVYAVVAGSDASCLPANTTSVGSSSSESTTLSTSASSQSAPSSFQSDSLSPQSTSTSSSPPSASPDSSDSSSRSNNMGYIGGIVGGIVAALLACGIAVFLVCRRRRNRRSRMQPRLLDPVTADEMLEESSAVIARTGGQMAAHSSRSANTSWVQSVATSIGMGSSRQSMITSFDISANRPPLTTPIIASAHSLTDSNEQSTQPYHDHVNVTPPADVHVATPVAERDTDAGITFVSDGVPDLLPPAYEDHRRRGTRPRSPK